MDATLPFRWRRSPSHGKCSRRFCGSLRNYGRSHHQHQRETLDGHALKSNRREECVLMPAKMSRSAPRPPFRLREVSIAVRTLRLSCRKAGKAPIFTPVRESSGESRLSGIFRIWYGSGEDDRLPFVLTLTPRYVARAAQIAADNDLFRFRFLTLPTLYQSPPSGPCGGGYQPNDFVLVHGRCEPLRSGSPLWHSGACSV